MAIKGRVAKFEGTEKEIIRWLFENKEEIAEKGARGGIEEVVLVKLPEKSATTIPLKDFPREKGVQLKVIEEEITDRIGDLIADLANRELSGEPWYFWSHNVPVDRELSLIHVYRKEPTLGRKLEMKYKEGTIGPVEQRVVYLIDFEKLLRVEKKK